MAAERYSRNFPMLAAEEQRRLHESCAAVVGCGGLGGYAIEMLVRLGIGRLKVFDSDLFEASNLNRQLLALPANLGQPKVEEARRRALAINPDLRIEARQIRLDSSNAGQYLQDCDLVLDAVDTIESRRDLVSACAGLAIPLIHGAIAGWYGQVSTLCPGDTTLDRLYRHTQQGVEKHLGTPSFTPALVASVQVSEAVKLLLGRGDLLRHKVLFIDLLHGEFEVVELEQ